MTDKAKAPEANVKLKDNVLAYAKKIEETLAIDKKTGAPSGYENIYEATLPEDVTMEMVNKVDEHDTTFIAAAPYVYGKLMVDAMASNGKLTEGSVVIPMGEKNTLSVGIERSKEFTNHLSGNGEKVMKYGVMTASYDVRGSRSNAGQLKAVRGIIGDLANAALSK